jgi:hypothetical protein
MTYEFQDVSSEAFRLRHTPITPIVQSVLCFKNEPRGDEIIYRAPTKILVRARTLSCMWVKS